MKLLPAELKAFLEAEDQPISDTHTPDWLRSEFRDYIWVVGYRKEFRLVNGAEKGGVVLRWNKGLPGGRWNDEANAKILTQCKRVTISAHEGAMALLGNSLRNIQGFHIYLHWFVEFLLLRYGSSFQSVGFEIADSDDIADFLAGYERGGVTETSQMIRRWEEYLSSKGLDPDDVTSVKAYLGLSLAFDKRGKVSSYFVSEALGISAARSGQLGPFNEYLMRYVDGSESRDAIKKMSRTAGLSRWAIILSKALAWVPDLSDTDLANVDEISLAVTVFRNETNERTITLPEAVASELIRECCKWILEVYPDIVKFYTAIVSNITTSENESASTLTKKILAAEAEVALTPILAGVVDKWRRLLASNPDYAPINSRMTRVFILFRLHLAVSFVIVGLLGCCRKQEVLDISTVDDILPNRKINVELRKTGFDGARRTMEKPVPQIAMDCISSLEKIKSILEKISPIEDPQVRSKAFYNLNMKGMCVLPRSAVDVYLEELCMVLDLRDAEGNCWALRSHQLRRYFAMSFFHGGESENSLAALSWFMGHEDVEATWRYIKESMTGKEITATEAAFAKSVIYSPDQEDNVRSLRSVVLRHFGCESLSMLTEDEVQIYLEMLAEKGAYSARPIQIKCGNNKVFTVLITILENIAGA